MKIALGSDHRGAEIARILTNDLFLPNHYSQTAEHDKSIDMTGAFLLEGIDPKSFDGDSPSSVENAERKITDLLATTARDEEGRVDYPDVAAAAASAVSEGRADRGVLICGTGIGMCITANKFRGVRAALCYNVVAAELSRRHNNANILCLSGEFLGVEAIKMIVKKWLQTGFDGGRHQRRLEILSAIERETGL